MDIRREEKMKDYEDLILESQESESDECTTCPYRETACNNQCLRVDYHYNPLIPKSSEVVRSSWRL